ncbi:hypothetical protein Metbo_1527 [Methanobacterium lacus]|uniref:DUF4013 domain-containing protein n=1 Tax=Methanobacterium lacus (strain AL-21) TaxID=877455 RepID=F0T8K6_METLA|nr:DUF4013 domain-containing protein [Methanobacterium lacus]ADZ09757.1 hypothetical protein Metbo_1527 [Methanobacterium lacus]
MNLKEVVIDAVKYPFLSVKNVLILFIFILIGFFVVLTSFFVNGYGYRIIKSSIVGEDEPPVFNRLGGMFLDGVKVFMVSFGYAIPVVVMIIIYLAAFVSSVMSYPNNTSIFVKFGGVGIVVAIVSTVYSIIITPIFAMALVYMADNNDQFSAAFRFREILNKIKNLGWKKLIIWYLTILLASIITIELVVVSTFISNMLNLPVQLLSAFIFTILFMYICRSTALFYTSDSPGYLVCEQCGGYYKLKSGESPEDFDTCECGGKLIYAASNPNLNESEESITNETVNRGIFGLSKIKKNKDSIILIGIVVLSILAIPVLIHSTQNQTPTNYTLLASYNVNNLTNGSKGVNIPQGTKNIKVDYNISWVDPGDLSSYFNLNAYDVYIGEGATAGMLNRVSNKELNLKKGQNKTGTYYFNKPPVKSIKLYGNGIQGTVNIYTSQ